MGSEYWERVRKRRVTRRRVLGAGALGASGAVLAATVGCGDDDDDDDDAGSGTAAAGGERDTSQLPERFREARYGGILRFGVNDPPQTLDLHAHDSPGGHLVAYPAYNGLIRRPENPPGNATSEPELVEEWEQPDETTTILHVRKGVKFHNVEPTNGREMTGEDIVYTIERAQGKHPHSSQVGGEFRMRDMFPVNLELTDDYTVRLTSEKPFAPLLNNLGFSWLMVEPRELVEATGDRSVITWAVGTGPFIMDGYDTLGDGGMVTHVRNPDYWRKGHPFVDKIEQPIVTGLDTLQAMYLNDDVDTTIYIQSAIVKAMEEAGKEMQIFPVPAIGPLKLYFDMANQDSPWTREQRLRQALHYLIPYDAILAGLDATCCRSGPMPPHYKPWALNESELPAAGMPFADAVQRGIELMTEAGFPPGTEIPLELSTSPFYSGTQIGEALVGVFGAIKQQTNGAVNINARLNVMELTDWFQQIYFGGGTYMATCHGDWSWEEPDNAFYRYFHSTGVANNTHTNDAELDRLIEQQRQELDPEKRLQIVRDIQFRLLDTSQMIWIVSPEGFTGAQRFIGGYSPMFLNNVESPRHFDELWLTEDAPSSRRT
ncbi:MAG TPA: ABC transporter substrate-binding protein [Dehalococcoidia bacterium]|nr:ABC transporter substrate-binding protein [Dehalococcoidia bacterium]